MAIPVDFLQTASGDLDLTQGLRQTPDFETFVRQKLSETIAFFKGEWFLDLKKGIPYFEYIYGHALDRNLVTSIYRKAAALTPGVGAVDGVFLEFDSTSRLLTPTIFCRTTTDRPVEFRPFVPEIT